MTWTFVVRDFSIGYNERMVNIMLNKKLIDASREIRLWTTGIIGVGILAYVNVPAVKKFVDGKIEKVIVKHNKTTN